MANYTFQTPYVLEGPSGGHRLFYFANLRKGITIVKSGATYSQIRYPVDEDLNDYDVVYRGGYNHTVDDAAKAELIAANVGVTEANFTVQ
jgi:hypothetical protein